MASAAVSQPPEAAAQTTAPWSAGHRVFFRFLCSYFVLYALPDEGRASIFQTIPGAAFLIAKYVSLWHALCPWVGRHWFHLSGRPITYFPTGSGDTTLDYIQNLLMLLFAIAAALVWTALDSRRANYCKLQPWLRLLVRYTLAFTLFDYGFAKIFPLQFRTPTFQKLIEPYGNFSPMGALWWFMGASTAYIVFAGAAEVTPGLLLLFRRTTTLGSLAAFAVLLNVAALNYCYDVPVKLYSTNLLLMAIYLASGDLRRLLNVFVLNRPAAPLDQSAPRFTRRWARIAASAFQVLFVGYALYSNIYGGWQAYKQAHVNPARPPVYGLWEVETFSRNGQDVPQLLTDAQRWRRVTAESPRFLAVQTMNDAVTAYGAEYDQAKGTLTLTESGDKTRKYSLAYSRPDPDHLALTGIVGNDTLSMRLRRIDASKFLLLSRGFHWINELPFNR
jgi:hypothetical protein